MREIFYLHRVLTGGSVREGGWTEPVRYPEPYRGQSQQVNLLIVNSQALKFIVQSWDGLRQYWKAVNQKRNVLKSATFFQMVLQSSIATLQSQSVYLFGNNVILSHLCTSGLHFN
jgi:hypothetical protein